MTVDERLFTREEAEVLIPRLCTLLEGLVEVSRQLADPELLRTARTGAAGNGGGRAARQLLEGGDRFNRIVGEIEDLGIVVRDPSTGLVDFPAERDGRPVYLCWRLGEAAVGFWHDRDTGYMGRQPL
ncbi:MAG: DUF2203 family protein [Chloroflexi bacterium]|nr:MAG: DUF2203 family protein [Chloroflexota bacterium]